MAKVENHSLRDLDLRNKHGCTIMVILEPTALLLKILADLKVQATRVKYCIGRPETEIKN